jgi:hypothetical protein
MKLAIISGFYPDFSGSNPGAPTILERIRNHQGVKRPRGVRSNMLSFYNSIGDDHAYHICSQ